jgi:hypothetical protein
VYPVGFYYKNIPSLINLNIVKEYYLFCLNFKIVLNYVSCGRNEEIRQIGNACCNRIVQTVTMVTAVAEAHWPACNMSVSSVQC